MSKAEQRGLEAYPIVISQHSDNCKDYDSNESDRLTFIEGYQQAEKDLSDISWIKEVSGVKEMSRAKEEALKAYPPQSIAANYDTIDRRDAFEYGYLKAEKDVAEAFARIIRGNLGGIGNGIQNMFEQLYTEITGEKMYKGFID